VFYWSQPFVLSFQAFEIRIRRSDHVLCKA
jgi:hypothetical protein